MGKVCKVATPITSVNGITINRSKPCHSSNYTNTNEQTVDYLVFHYTGNSKDTASANANWFAGANREASAHYIVDDTSIWQSVNANDRAWHCGTTGTYYHSSCRNSNSLGIEMCCTAGNYKISNKTKENAAQLGAALCKYFGITDVDKYVLRHYDITRKQCPLQMAGSNNAEWQAFKNRIKEIINGTSNAKPADLDAIDILVKNGVINSPDYWEDVQYNLNHLYTLLDNLAKNVGPKAVEDINTAREAIEHLVECGVINSPDYWLSNYSKVKYLDKLLISAASHIPSKFVAYKVKVTTDALNIRKGPGTGHSVVGCIRDEGVYTIIAESNGWGQLKSKEGWISLAYTKKV